ncbi:ADOP family duplicated permease [Actomonas aquatica]|uniref:ADOP family duplicated permease n=1 Tax=Actomonas aquatica TaxID=2866162 RepID=A0ABZ1C237_9BACT|nr:ADOP family duplicated permease [Opitutus sp. WL0086]WRQ85600.1 ADOP family duplicated permease [Opitutus sp. WL0086]
MNAVRQALRQLRAHPWFNLLVIVLLACGIAANTTMFSFVRGVLLKPLPYPQSGELVLLRKQAVGDAARLPGGGAMVIDKEWLAWRDAAPPAFRAFAAYRSGSATLKLTESAHNVSVTRVTADFFNLLGQQPARGRLLQPSDLVPGATPVAVLSHAFWQSRFGGDEAVLGSVLRLDDEAVTVVGILPAAFKFIEPAQLWLPLVVHEAASSGGDSGEHEIVITMLSALARLQPDASLEAAQAQLEQASDRMWSTFGDGGPEGAPSLRDMLAPLRGGPAQAIALQEYLAGDLRSTLWLLFGAVGLVLLIGCVNLANLQLARAATRRHELAVRVALGASRRQLAADLLAETTLPALLGGALGLLLSYWGIQLVGTWMADQLPDLLEIGIDGCVATFTLLLAVGTGIGFGLAPVWQIRRLDASSALHSAGRTGTGAPTPARWRHTCIALEVALALALAANAGLLLRSFNALRAVDLGFHTADVLTLQLPTDTTLRPEQAMHLPPEVLDQIHSRARDLRNRYLDVLSQVQGVSVASIANRAPLDDFNLMFMSDIEGYEPDLLAPPAPLTATAIDATYLDAVGMDLIEGRNFTTADGVGAPPVALVNEAFVRQYFPGQSVVGRRLASPDSTQAELATIVGVVGDTRRSALDSSPQAHVYFPFAQWSQTRLTALLRVTGDPDVIAAGVIEALRRFDATKPYDQPVVLESRLNATMGPRRLLMGLLSGFAAVAIILAALGILGVMGYAVTQRTHEFGVRMALGADPRRILTQVLGSTGLAIGVGLLAGLALTFATTRLISALLFGVGQNDPTVLATACLVLGAVALLAALGPAWRAARLNPVDALRAD